MKRQDGHRTGHWLPHQKALKEWLERFSKDVRTKAGGSGLHPAVEEFRELINGDPIVRLLIGQMIEEVPGS
jgi:phosphatidylserine decarboxylase